MNAIKITPLWHYRISRVIAWLPKIPIFGKVFAPMAQLAHLAIVYQQVIAEGEQQWKQKRAKIATP